jgi:sodium/potassium-transporting ATPase subunit alpha
MPPEREMKAVVVEKRGEQGEYVADEHLLALEALAARHGTRLDAQSPASSQGLSPDEAAARLASHGPNVLVQRKKMPEWLRFLHCFKDPLLIQLVVAGVLCFIAFAIDSASRTAKVNLYLGGALFAIVLATGVLTYVQERHTQAILAQISGMLASRCLVVRDGAERRIDAALLVPGDVVRLALGDRVPADLRVIVCDDMRTDKSGITGESQPVRASAEADAPGTLALHASSLIFNSSLVVAGEGFGVVTRTGNETMIGSIASLAGGTAGVGQTLLQKEVQRFVIFIAALAVMSAVPLFIIGMARAAAIHDGSVPRASFTNALVAGLILVVVANTPQGLPATLSSCLAITARRMAQRHVIIKKLDTIESLGSATVICTDKTGTLTENKMSVEHLFYSRSVYHAASTMTLHQREHTTGVTPDPEGGPAELYEVAPKVQRVLSAAALEEMAAEEENSYTLSGFTVSGPAVAQKMGQSVPPWRAFTPHAKLLAISALCNRARPAAADAAPAPPSTGAAEQAVTGNAADAALFRYAELFFAVSSARAQFPKVHDVPFSSATKFAATVVTDRAGPSDRQIVMFKGAPEVILQRCGTWLHGKTEHPIDDAFREEFTHVYERFGALGERVLGFAYAFVPTARADVFMREPERIPSSGAVFVGLISLVDPPRAGVAEAIATCRRAGIAVTMVTGDSPITAEAIARKVGIITQPTRHDLASALHVPDADVAAGDARIGAIVVTGEQLNALSSDADWDALLSKPELIIARSSPQQKLKLVENYQRRGEIVAVTGDGVNDAPALKRAHIGVAMGSAAASDVAREAADIVLMDDNFASIVNAIEEGRTCVATRRGGRGFATHARAAIFAGFLITCARRLHTRWLTSCPS